MYIKIGTTKRGKIMEITKNNQIGWEANENAHH